MAFTKKALNDHFQASFGQESETAPASADGLIIGGVYQSTDPTIATGEFSRLQTDATGNLKVSTGAVTYKGTVTIAISKTIGTLACPITGLTRRITQSNGALNGTGTATLTVTDSVGGTVVALAAQDESVITSYGTVEALTDDMEILATANGTQAAIGTIIIDVHYMR